MNVMKFKISYTINHKWNSIILNSDCISHAVNMLESLFASTDLNIVSYEIMDFANFDKDLSVDESMFVLNYDCRYRSNGDYSEELTKQYYALSNKIDTQFIMYVDYACKNDIVKYFEIVRTALTVVNNHMNNA